MILKKLIKKPSLELYPSAIDFFKYLDKYLKNNNIRFTYFIIIIYILIAILPFMILRFNRLGTSYALVGLNNTNNTFIISLIFFILSCIYVFKILNSIIYEYILKLHYYLHNKYEKYHDFVEDNIFLKEWLIFHYFCVIGSFCFHLEMDKKDFIENYVWKKKLRGNYQTDALKNEYIFYLKIRYFRNKYSIIKFIIYILSNVVHKIAFHGGRFVYYIPYSLVCIALGVDIIKGNLYYIFYALLYLYITNMIKKVRKFYYEKDPVYDNMLSSYFYNNTEYVLLGKLLEEKDEENLYKLRQSNNKLFECINNANSLIEYINSDFKVYYVTDIVRASNEKYIMNNYKRLHVILLLLLFNVYMLYFNKYVLILLNMEINFVFINILLLIIIYYIHRQIAQELPTHWVENKKPQWYFRIIMFFYIVINLYIFIQNKFDPNVVEVLVSFKNMLIIKENFSLNEKYSYLKYYIEQLKNNVNIDSIILDNVFLKIINENYITSTMTLEDIRNIVQELYNETKNNLLLEKKYTFLSKILIALKKFWI